MTITINTDHAMIHEDEFQGLLSQVKAVEKNLRRGNSQGADFLGWLDYPNSYDKEEFDRIKKAAAFIRSKCEAFIVIGIGGSYLGSKAIIEAMSPFFANESDEVKTKIYFAGQNLSGKYHRDLIRLVKDKDVMVNVISKSGTTTEPAIAFRLFKELLEEKYGVEGSRERIFVTTDAKKGALKDLATDQGYETFVVPDDVGGRYSVHTAVGLLPIAAAGFDIDAFMKGAKDQMEEVNACTDGSCACHRYALARNILYQRGKAIEIMVNYQPEMQMFAEWWKQLFGESEGKDGKGHFPASVNNSTDLHSMGQIIQQGRRNIFETVIAIDQVDRDVTIPESEGNLDGLNYIAGMGMNQVNHKAYMGAMLAHVEGLVPNVVLQLEDLSMYSLGALVYFFERACAISGYLMGVNPFNQPGVESYKRNMFALLGKPGFAELAEKLKEKH